VEQAEIISTPENQESNSPCSAGPAPCTALIPGPPAPWAKRVSLGMPVSPHDRCHIPAIPICNTGVLMSPFMCAQLVTEVRPAQATVSNTRTASYCSYYSDFAARSFGVLCWHLCRYGQTMGPTRNCVTRYCQCSCKQECIRACRFGCSRTCNAAMVILRHSAAVRTEWTNEPPLLHEGPKTENWGTRKSSPDGGWLRAVGRVQWAPARRRPRPIGLRLHWGAIVSKSSGNSVRF
jgi:hypothetical protein